MTIHQSAIKPQLVMGIPRQLALVLYTLMAALTIPLGTWYAIPPGHFLAWRVRGGGQEGPTSFGMCSAAPFCTDTFYRGLDHEHGHPIGVG